ncbi:serine/threonine-protein kinase [Anaeromyxobacter terrae]|uniref:hypothetical protein n=1 Tax=Anaeromyxobacter terrae TaxID=2925406 RepID=UPI001F56F5E1|nr:hypothetical protein [Anaeromyxobacter sp. SG22]
MTPDVGEVVLGHYQVVKSIGYCDMPWLTYGGRDVRDGSAVVLRIANPDASRDRWRTDVPGLETPTKWAEAVLAREARALSRLDHPRIYSLRASGPGINATERLWAPSLDRPFALTGGHPEIAALIVRQVADVLEHAHSRGVFRLVPTSDGVRLGDDGGCKLVDFRLAMILDDDPAAPKLEHLRRQELHRWGAGFAHREALQRAVFEDWGADLAGGDARTEVLCIGALLSTLISGFYPRFGGQRLFGGPGGMRFLGSPALARFVERALSLDRAKRPSSAAAARDELDQILGEVGIVDADAEIAALVADRESYFRSFPARMWAALESSPGALARRGAEGAKLFEELRQAACRAAR